MNQSTSKNLSNNAHSRVKFFQTTRNTFIDISRVFYFCAILGGVMLLVLRLLYGKHKQGQEIIVLATPLILLFIAFRVVRIGTPPLAPEERDSVHMRLNEVLSGLFGLGMGLEGLIILSYGTYIFFGISWAATAALSMMQFCCLGLAVLAAGAFCTSDSGASHLKRAIRWLMGLPESFRAKIESATHVGMNSRRSHEHP